MLSKRGRRTKYGTLSQTLLIYHRGSLTSSNQSGRPPGPFDSSEVLFTSAKGDAKSGTDRSFSC